MTRDTAQRSLCLQVALATYLLLCGALWAQDNSQQSVVRASLTPGILQNWTLPVYVGTVKASSSTGTIAAPPTSVIDVERTLRGEPIHGPLRVIWTEGVSTVTFADRACIDGPFDPKRNCTYILAAAQLAIAVAPPIVGEKLIFVTIKPDSNRLDPTTLGSIPGIANRLATERALAASAAYPASSENLIAFSKRALSREPMSKRFNTEIFIGTFIAAITSMYFSFARPSAGLGIGLLTFILYSFYGSGVSTDINIRVDLIFLYPALGLALIAIVLSIARLGRSDANAST